MLFALVFALFYGLRAVLIASGLDVPYPEQFFEERQVAALATTTVLWLTAFLAMFFAGAYVTSTRATFRSTLIFARQAPDLRRLLTVVVVLTSLATLISLLLTIQYGGVGNFIRAVKIDKSLTGLYFLKVPAAMGALCSVAAVIELRKAGSSVGRRVAPAFFALALLNGFWVFIWGQRSTLAIMGVMLVLGLIQGRSGRIRARSAVAAILAVAVIVVGVSTGLRVARDQLVSGEVQDVVAEASVWRQISIGTNSIYFDSSMLAFRDWPQDRPYRLGSDFANSASGFVPRILWEGKPTSVVAGKDFRQVYQPRVVNGWPVGAPTLWWLNFGPLGVLIGGLLSGLIIGALQRAQRMAAPSGLNFGVALVTMIYVLQTGFGPEWPVAFTAWLVPLGLIMWYVAPHSRPAMVEAQDPVTLMDPVGAAPATGPRSADIPE
ncbi:O-antigen polymerase [Nocardioides sp. AX2bis]|uniref:O-antigen polymerase n=1 Tax=Nocardioides sp. AX2bis TaxID=2653157 RepID=UPI003FA52314